MARKWIYEVIRYGEDGRPIDSCYFDSRKAAQKFADQYPPNTAGVAQWPLHTMRDI